MSTLPKFKTKPARDLAPGDQISSNDGAVLTVATVTPSASGKTLSVTFERGPWIVQPGPAKVRAAALVTLPAFDEG
jgi:hypothetical protein